MYICSTLDPYTVYIHEWLCYGNDTPCLTETIESFEEKHEHTTKARPLVNVCITHDDSLVALDSSPELQSAVQKVIRWLVSTVRKRCMLLIRPDTLASNHDQHPKHPPLLGRAAKMRVMLAIHFAPLIWT